MKNLLVLAIGLALGAGAYWFFSHHGSGEKSETHAAHEEVAHEANGEIKLDAKQQAAVGIQTAQPTVARLPDVAKGYGRALDPAPFIALALDVEAAKAALSASEKEYERAKTLFAQGQNASARSLEAAEAAARRDRILLNLAETKLQTSLGPALSARKDLPELMASLSKMKASLLRIDLSFDAGEISNAHLRVAPLGNENAWRDAELLGPAPNVEASIQGRGFLGLLQTNALPVNAAILGLFELAGHESEGVVIPAAAVLQDGPEQIVFLKTGEETFRKTSVEVERVVEKGWFIKEGLSPTNLVVIVGAHQILSITKGEAPE